MSKRAIPKVPQTEDGGRRAFDEAVKENLEVIMGRRGGKIQLLTGDETLVEVIKKFNELVGAVQ